MKRHGLTFGVSLLALAAALSAQAQPFSGRGPVAFGAMDLDGDGYVSPAEFSRHRDARMAERAAQGRLLRNAGRAPLFESWDENGDGRLSRGEVSTGQRARFANRGAGGRPCRRYR
jgi:hypothetical protein